MLNLNKKPRKAISTRNGLKIFTKLKTNTKLKAQKPLEKISERQKIKNQTWKKITDGRCIEEQFTCQWCKIIGKRDNGFNSLTGHHIIPRRYGNNTKQNCYIAHKICHSEITDHNINVLIYPTRKTWENRNALL